MTTIKINDLLEDNRMGMTQDLTEILAKALKKHFPLGVERWESKGCSEATIVWYFCNVDLPETDVKEILYWANKYAKMWSFS